MLDDLPESDAIVLRIIDANINRCAEGIRVIEEIARFAVGDEQLTRAVKDLRHEVRGLSGLFTPDTTRFRDSAGDVGGRFSTPSEERRESLAGTARANFFRVEEGLRVIEEFAKLGYPEGSRRAKSLRFRVYEMEKAFLAGGPAEMNFPGLPFLYTFIDRSIVPEGEVAAVVATLAEGGSGMIQYRAKDISVREMRRDLASAIPVAEKAGIPLIVNDLPELAVETGAGGVHLGSSDADPSAAREMLGPARIIGLSVRTPGEIASAPLELLDYIAVGAVFPTFTKADAVVTGLDLVSSARRSTSLPVIAIGGIRAENARSVLDAGADGLAVISAVLRGDTLKNCFTFSEIIDKKRIEMAGA
jgi:thiamine-phosphate pyrophosphorylase